MAALPYMQLYVSDYLADTFHLTTEEHGAYLLILMTYWQRGKPIHKDRLAKAARLSNERWTDVERSLKEYFNEDENGYWVSERIEQDLGVVLAKSKQYSRAGKRSAEARKKKKEVQDDENTKEVNERSTNVEIDLERTLNHTDTETDTDTDKKNKNLKKRVKGMDMLLKAGVPEDLAEDFLAVRRAKKAPFTKTALKGIIDEADKAGIDLNKAITICINRNWTSFNSEWAWNNTNNTQLSSTGGIGHAAHNSTPKPETRREHHARISDFGEKLHAEAIAAAIADGTLRQI